jgi:hypothetical protein
MILQLPNCVHQPPTFVKVWTSARTRPLSERISPKLKRASWRISNLTCDVRLSYRVYAYQREKLP